MNNSDSNDIKRLKSSSNLQILNASIDMDRYKAIKGKHILSINT